MINAIKSRFSYLQSFNKIYPLIDEEQKLAVYWTPKGGCTFVVKWFFSQMGLLEEALDFHHYVHRYRNQVFKNSEKQKNALKHYLNNPSEYRSVKVVRDPCLRAVSSYIHTNKHNYSDEAIGKFLNRKLDRENRFSFSEFVDYLETVNIRTCDKHYRSQVSHLEYKNKVNIDYVIDLPQAEKELQELELKLGLKKTDVSSLIFSSHHSRREESSGFVGNDIIKVKSGFALPSSQQFYTDELKAKVRRIYADDISRYSAFITTKL